MVTTLIVRHEKNNRPLVFRDGEVWPRHYSHVDWLTDPKVGLKQGPILFYICTRVAIGQ